MEAVTTKYPRVKHQVIIRCTRMGEYILSGESVLKIDQTVKDIITLCDGCHTTTQIAEWKHNKTPIPTQIRILNDIVKAIYDKTQDATGIYYSIENNTIGEAALISLAEFGEDNFPGMMLSEPKSAGSGRRYRKGFNTTNKTKIAACAKLKNLVETRKMTVNSKSLISEFKTFVAHGTSYAAKIGETDDLVMSTVLAVRMMQVLQNYHADLNIQLKDFGDEVIEPMPFIMF